MSSKPWEVHRSLLFVPDEAKRNNKFFKNEEFEMMEVNGLWIGPALKSPSMQLKGWGHLIKDIFIYHIYNNNLFWFIYSINYLLVITHVYR